MVREVRRVGGAFATGILLYMGNVRLCETRAIAPKSEIRRVRHYPLRGGERGIRRNASPRRVG